MAWRNSVGQFKKSGSFDLLKLQWLSAHLDSLTLNQITAVLIEQVALKRLEPYEQISKYGKRRVVKTTPATVNRYLAVISAVLHYAHSKEWTPAVPKIKFFQERDCGIRWITKEQADALIAELPDHLADMARFALATGFRRANVTGLTWGQVDLDRAVAGYTAIRRKRVNQSARRSIPRP